MESLVARAQSALVQVDPGTGLLIFRDSPYRLTRDQIYTSFVERAPFQQERELLFSAFNVYLNQTMGIVPDSKIWVDGSFVSLINDRAPSDVDLLLLVNNPTQAQKNELGRRGLLTMSEVGGKLGDTFTPTLHKLAPYGGLVDAYYVDAAHSNIVSEWEFNWSTPKDEKGQLDFSRSKGFVEVIL